MCLFIVLFFHSDSLIICLSALYGKLLVVMGMAFPMAEVISKDLPSSFYNVSIYIFTKNFSFNISIRYTQ